MSAKCHSSLDSMKDLFSSFLNAHNLERTLLLDILAAWRAGSMAGSPAQMIASAPDQDKIAQDRLTQNECLTSLVLPAFAAAFKESDLWNMTGTEIEVTAIARQGGGLPHTMDRGTNRPVLIALN